MINDPLRQPHSLAGSDFTIFTKVGANGQTKCVEIVSTIGIDCADWINGTKVEIFSVNLHFANF